MTQILTLVQEDAPAPLLIAGYIIGAIAFIVFVCFRVGNRAAVARGAFGATNGSANAAALLAGFLLLAALAYLFKG